MVALESTIVAHGMPWPDNLVTAQAVEDVVRERGAVPATVAIVEGSVRCTLNSPLRHDQPLMRMFKTRMMMMT